MRETASGPSLAKPKPKVRDTMGHTFNCPLCGDWYLAYGDLSRHLYGYHRVDVHRIADISPKPALA